MYREGQDVSTAGFRARGGTRVECAITTRRDPFGETLRDDCRRKRTPSAQIGRADLPQFAPASQPSA